MGLDDLKTCAKQQRDGVDPTEVLKEGSYVHIVWWGLQRIEGTVQGSPNQSQAVIKVILYGRYYCWWVSLGPWTTCCWPLCYGIKMIRKASRNWTKLRKSVKRALSQTFKGRHAVWDFKNPAGLYLFFVQAYLCSVFLSFAFLLSGYVSSMQLGLRLTLVRTGTK